MPNAQSNDSMNDTHSNPEWVKVKTPKPRRPASTPLEPHQGWEDRGFGFGPFAPTSPGYSGPNEEELDERQREAKQNMEHAGLSWTACYDEHCQVHKSDKEATGWFPKEPRHHTIHRDTPYEKQPSDPPTPPQPPKPRHGNNKEEHTKRVTWDKCYNKRCKIHRQRKEQEGYFPYGVKQEKKL